ncbi:MAG TPA: hypothetical protein VH025_08370 [Solirubrobacteraceae bacterium]|jgi:hypothetical protein|nr:hypothetical protein [Solirubrobacteraceae bacterium]
MRTTLGRRLPVASVATAASLAMLAPAASALTNGAATHAYLEANAKLVKIARANLPTLEQQPKNVLRQVTRECPLAAGSDAPQDAESTQMSYEIIGAMVISAGKRIRPSVRAFVAQAKSMHWSSPAVERPIRKYVASLAELDKLEVPSLCSDGRAWAEDGYAALPAPTVTFDKAFIPNWVAVGLQPPALLAQASAADRALARHTTKLEEDVTDGEARAVETYRLIMNELGVWP